MSCLYIQRKKLTYTIKKGGKEIQKKKKSGNLATTSRACQQSLKRCMTDQEPHLRTQSMLQQKKTYYILTFEEDY